MRIVSPLLAALLAAAATPALASIDVSIIPTFSGSIAAGSGASQSLGQPTVDKTLIATDGSGASAQAQAVTILTSGGGFFFEHDLVGNGSSSVTERTFLDVTVTNSGPAQDLRFDSQVTPGHLGARDAGGGSASSLARFAFSIGLLGGKSKLYDLGATLFTDGLSLQSNGPFTTLNGYKDQTIGNERVVDWGATNIAIDLGRFKKGETRTYRYDLLSAVDIRGSGEGFAPSCNAAQIAAGDPRSGGQPLTSTRSGVRAAAAGRDGSKSCEPFRVNPIIGLPFAQFLTYIHIVPEGAPAEPPPPPPTPISYAVPEPGALALLGLGAVSLAVARRRR
jgi:hypothetical protein